MMSKRSGLHFLVTINVIAVSLLVPNVRLNCDCAGGREGLIASVACHTFYAHNTHPCGMLGHNLLGDLLKSKIATNAVGRKVVVLCEEPARVLARRTRAVCKELVVASCEIEASIESAADTCNCAVGGTRSVRVEDGDVDLNTVVFVCKLDAKEAVGLEGV